MLRRSWWDAEEPRQLAEELRQKPAAQATGGVAPGPAGWHRGARRDENSVSEVFGDENRVIVMLW